jgi:uncharacterized protein (TIGR02147 family)
VQVFGAEVSASLKGSGLIYAILKGKRKISPAFRPRFARALQLKDREAHYFELLIQFNQAKTLEDQNHYFQNLSRFRNSRAMVIGPEQYRFFTQWYYPVIWNFFGIDRNQSNPAAIARRIQPPVTPAQVEEAIRLLLHLKLIKKTPNGYAVVENHLAAENDFNGVMARQYNKTFIGMAADVLDTVPSELRQYNTLVTSTSAKGFAEIRDRMRAFHQEIMAVVDRDREADRVYVFCMQMFPALKAG